MTAEDQIYILIFQQRPVFRMMGEYDFIPGLRGKRRYPVRLWLMSSGAGGTSDAVQILSAWIPRFGRLCGSGSSIVPNVTGGQSGDDDLFRADGDGLPLVIQHSYACGRQEPEVLRIHHPLMIAEGEKGRGDGGAGMKEGENVGLGSHRTRIIFWPATVQDVAGDADEGRGVVTEGGKHGFWISIMQIGKERQGSWAAWNFVG